MAAILVSLDVDGVGATEPAAVESSWYRYDAAGRLVQAVIPHHTLDYVFASTGGVV